MGVVALQAAASGGSRPLKGVKVCCCCFMSILLFLKCVWLLFLLLSLLVLASCSLRATVCFICAAFDVYADRPTIGRPVETRRSIICIFPHFSGRGGFQMGVIREALVERVQPDVAAAVKDAIDVRHKDAKHVASTTHIETSRKIRSLQATPFLLCRLLRTLLATVALGHRRFGESEPEHTRSTGLFDTPPKA